jgi:hypothetical protein
MTKHCNYRTANAFEKIRASAARRYQAGLDFAKPDENCPRVARATS